MQHPDSTRRIPDLPTELWSLILLEVGTSNRSVLLPFLLVSRGLFRLVVPILYEHINLKVIHQRDGHVLPSLAESSQIRDTKRFELSIIHTLLDTTSSTVLSKMTSLQKLKLGIVGMDRSPLTSIGSTSLTHLTYIGTPPLDALQNLIAAQSCLVYLELRSPGARALTVPENSLKNLHTFIGSPQLWSALVRGRRIEHLGGTSELRHIPSTPDIYLHLRTLNVICVSAIISQIFPYLKHIEYLYITMRGWEEGDIHQHLLSIPSTTPRYFNLDTQYTRPPNHAADMFRKFPHLCAADYGGVLDDSAPPKQVQRYLRNQTLPLSFVIAPVRTWEHWWNGLGL
ncbi:hypothetical protein ONZ45_g18918 [Pleurotus djamor]|nr:hypothetical protein ONZ45_g18918 [Pleurotus djamor]